MKALVLEEYNKLVYKDVSDPVIKDDDVLVKVMACGICGSDIHGMDGSTGRRIPPLIMGHEASGVIVKTGRDVIRWQEGDRVTFDSTIYPPNDWYTLNGHYNLSDNREVLGVSPGNYKRNGAFSEYVAIPQHILYRIPDTVSFEQAAMVEGVAVALHAVNISGMRMGDSCIVTGAGMIGSSLLKLLRISGASVIIAVDNDARKLEQAIRSGADMAFLPDDKDLPSAILKMNHGRGADFSFEAVGNNEAVNLCVSLVRKGGTVVLVGNTTPVVEIPLQQVVTREIRLQGSCAICGEYETVLELMGSGKLNVDDQISAVAPLVDGADWFRRLYTNEENLKKVILVP